ncbi:MAG: Fe-S cluster assembly protein SufB [Candidatus Eremiobacteraeota bacterium]|nr:Fe-S cluster assembly protein SufB [Candidatus Eremiobacteraeota bacterium]MBC5802189.1 Fe-S cluster assembly protein SufB [Candidatus Eremiobacteraeota bacterium]MBC5821431.1 Fe-S cluster assembly protein SufB [Candidatus Eremiobacteraeota bacterium]
MALDPQATAPSSFDEDYRHGFHDSEANYVFKSDKGLTREIVERISSMKGEPAWMTAFRLKSYEIFRAKPMPPWGDKALLEEIDFDDIHYYVKSSEKTERSWDDVPDDIKRTFDRLGIPEAERKFLSGVSAQYESEVVYHSVREDLAKDGVIFCDMDTALREHPEIVKKYFATVIPPGDNKFSALNSSVWSGGSFVYVPPGVEVKTPLQAYFRINTENMGQFERTLIIADKGAKVHYIEGCTAPQFSTASLHSAVVELIAMEGSSIRYTTIQNWYRNIFNLVTKRAYAHAHATVEWVDGNIGSRLTMKYPSIYLMGEGARGEILSMAFAGEGQHQDAGAKMIHAAPNTTSVVTNKSVSAHGGKTTYRGLVEIFPNAVGAKTRVKCDALIMDEQSSSDTKPTMKIDQQKATVEHEASVSKIGEEQLFYAMSRGLSEADATAMIVNGFFDFFVKELPMEYAVELNRLVKMEMEGAVG